MILDDGTVIKTPQGTTIDYVEGDNLQQYTQLTYPNGNQILINGESTIFTDNPPPASSKNGDDPGNDPDSP